MTTQTMRAKYVNPFTDFGFKKIFGEEASKPLLIDFLNSLLPTENRIKTLSFKNPEQLGASEADRKAIYDIYCESEKGEKFIVELQKAKQNYFRERTIYYSTFPIREQAEKGEWNYNLKAVFCIGILDFVFDDEDEAEAERKEVVHVVKLKNGHNKVFYDKLTYIYLEMPNFHKTESELETRLDQWLYFLKYLEDFQSIPHLFQEEAIFTQAFETAALAKLSPEEMDSYEYSLKVFRDLKNVMDYAIETAVKEAVETAVKEAVETAVKEAEEKTKEAVETAVKEAEEKAKEAVETAVKEAEEKAKEAVETAVKEAEEKAKEAVETAVKEVEEKAKDAVEMAMKEAEEKAQNDMKKVAKSLKDNAIEISIIMATTGLSSEEIEKL